MSATEDNPRRPSKILPSLLTGHQELLLEDLRRRAALGSEGELEVADDLSIALVPRFKDAITYY